MRKIPLPDENRKRAERLLGDSGSESFSSRKNTSKSVGEGLAPPNSKTDDFSKECEELVKKNVVSVGEGLAPPDSETDDYSSDTEELVKNSTKKTAKEYALLLVSTHTYTEKSLIQKIRSKKIYSDEDIEDAV